MFNIAICDDDALHREHTAALIKDMPEYVNAGIRQFSRPENLLDAICEDMYIPDIAMLDIEMEEINGIELAQKLNRLSPDCQIIFLTGYIEYATRAYDAEHVFYVLKTEGSQRLRAALDKAVEKRRQSISQHIIVTVNGAARRLQWEQVQYLERVLRRTRIVITDGDIWTSTPPRDIVSQLDERCYCQCHKSFYVNTACLVSMLPTEFVLKSGLRVPISLNYQKSAKESFLFKTIRGGR